MRNWKFSFAVAGVFAIGVTHLLAQEPAVTSPGAVRGPGATAETTASAAAVKGSKEDPAAVERSYAQKLLTRN
jgi:hypothetical protein